MQMCLSGFFCSSQIRQVGSQAVPGAGKWLWPSVDVLDLSDPSLFACHGDGFLLFSVFLFIFYFFLLHQNYQKYAFPLLFIATKSSENPRKELRIQYKVSDPDRTSRSSLAILRG